MGLTDPVVAYTAESDQDALLAQQFLQGHGVEAYTTDESSMVSNTLFGNLPEKERPQVFVSRSDAERAAELIVEYDRGKAIRAAERKANESKTITATCEECGQTSSFPGSLAGTVQDCPHCGAYMDVGTFAWPEDDNGA